MVRVLFVCLGNICRSPTAEGVFRHLVESEGLSEVIDVDSAGTAGYHVGQPPDGRSQDAARLRGIDLSGQRARQVKIHDFERFDYLLAMDDENFANLMAICPPNRVRRVQLFMDYAPGMTKNVPDPYYGQGNGFETVLDMIEVASKGLLADIRGKHL